MIRMTLVVAMLVCGCSSDSSPPIATAKIAGSVQPKPVTEPAINSPAEEKEVILVDDSDEDPLDPKWHARFLSRKQPLANLPVIVSRQKGAGDIRVKVKNAGSTILEYYAAGVDGITLFQEIHEDDAWSFASWEWCGMGKTLFEIKPQESVSLKVTFWDEQKRERMLGRFSEKGTNCSGFILLATEESE